MSPEAPKSSAELESLIHESELVVSHSIDDSAAEIVRQLTDGRLVVIDSVFVNGHVGRTINVLDAEAEQSICWWQPFSEDLSDKGQILPLSTESHLARLKQAKFLIGYLNISIDPITIYGDLWNQNL